MTELTIKRRLKERHGIDAESLLKYFVTLPILIWVIVFFGNMVPVVQFEKGVTVEVTGQSAMLRVSGFKIIDCRYLGGESGFIKFEDKELWVESEFEYVADLSPGSNRPRKFFERQDFGLWKWRKNPLDIYSVGDKIVEVFMTVDHDCGGKKPKVSVIGPFDVDWSVGGDE